MVRDTRADVNYFHYFVKDAEYINSCIEGKIRCETRPEIFNPDRYSDILSSKLMILIAYYSGGIDLEIIRREFIKIIPDFHDYWTRDCYGDLIRTLSWAVLFEIDDENFTLLKEAALELRIGRKLKEDWLVNYLLHSRFPEISYQDTPFRLKRDQCYREMIESENPKEALYSFAKSKWYNKQRGEAWWGSHKKVDRGAPVYFGYWCFEVAAIVKILGIDDEEFKNIVYYPYDLAQYTK